MRKFLSHNTMKKTDNVVRFDWAAKNILRDKASFVILEGFLSALLGEKVTIMELLESESNRQRRTAKANRVDVKAMNSKGEIFLIEIQQASESDYLERIVFSTAKTITEHVDSGIDYKQVKKVYSVNIVYFNLGEGSDYLYHGQSILRGVNTGDTLRMSGKDSKGIRMVSPKSVFPEYYILRVKKFNDEEPETALGEWMRYFKWGYIDPNTKVAGLREAMERLDVLKLSEQDRKRYEYDLYDSHYEEDIVDTARFEGREEGLAQGRKEGLEQGRMEGVEQGRMEGLEQGRLLEKEAMAKKMREAGIDLDIITMITSPNTTD